MMVPAVTEVWRPQPLHYADASWTQSLADWIGAHTRAFAALGGAPRLLVPDDTRSGRNLAKYWG